MPQPFVTRAVLRTVESLPEYPRLRVLDLSCGRGEILARLHAAGCEVRGSHYRSDDYQLEGEGAREMLDGLEIDPGVDLQRPLPYESGAYDLVLLSEVVEHLPTPIALVAEVGRILTDGGRLLLTTPNVARLHSRWHFFWTGTHKLIRRRVGWDLAPDELYAYHIGPVDFPLLHTLLAQAGLEVERLAFTRFKLRHAWLLALYPAIAVASWLEFRGGERKADPRRAAGERDLARWMLHPAMLASEQLLVVARKRRAGIEARAAIA